MGELGNLQQLNKNKNDNTKKIKYFFALTGHNHM